jgi:hypothetical protein
LSGYGGDDSICAYLANAIAAGVGDVEIAAGVHGDALRESEPGAGCRAGVSREAKIAVSSHSADDSASSHFANAVVGRVRNVEVATGVYGYAIGLGETGVGRRAAIARKAAKAVAGDWP